MSSHLVKNKKYGNVTFKISRLDGCCGVSVIHHVYFERKGDTKKCKEELYKWFYNTVIFGKRNILNKSGPFYCDIIRENGNWLVNKFIMSDRTTNLRTCSVYEFCNSIEDIKKGDVNYNPNSGYRIQSFELNRPKDKYSNYNGNYVEQKNE